MKLLMQYLSRYKLLIFVAIVLATINQSFSLINPILSGRILDRLVNHSHSFDVSGKVPRSQSAYFSLALTYIAAIMGIAMVSRIAKNFQDYVVTVVIQK